ncbi:MAG: type VI secretion system contractile sheath large subunit [Ketobacteraceae bacterium]|nr:type VI secretion system contractile sheath large subunit [Ketobacteraceae bacterium]
MAETTTGGITFEFKHREEQKPRPGNNAPFHLLIMGNFSGADFRQRADYPDIRERPWYRIDCDDIDDVMGRIAPTLTLSASDKAWQYTPKTIDDFHPDEIFADFPPFQELKILRRQLQNNSTFAQAASTLEQWLGIRPAEPSEPQAPQQSSAAEDEHQKAPADGSLLDSILDAGNQSTESPVSGDAATTAWLRDLVDEAVAPYTLPGKDPRQEDYLALLDRSISDLMRTLLHSPAFQSLESHWRGLDFILRRTTSESRLNIYLWDVCKEELLADLAQQGNATESDFYQRIAKEFAASDESLSAIVSSFDFGAKKQDALMLGIMAKLCSTLDCPFIANGDASLAHSDNFFLSDDYRDWNTQWDPGFAQTWQAVRNMPESHYLALAAPRFLIRYPYDAGHYGIESFRFQELQNPVSRSELLWAPGAFAVAAVLARSFNENGWQMRPGDFTDLNRLPIAFFDEDGQKEVIPNGECFLTEIMFNRLCDSGLTPITGLKNSDTLKVGPILGLHERSPLLGPWI